MKKLLPFILGILLLAGCLRHNLPTSEVVQLPKALQGMQVGDSANLGYGFVYTRINESQAVRTAPVSQAVIRKCKNCGNTYTKDKSDNSDHSKTKDKSDNSLLKGAEADSRVQQPTSQTQSGGFLTEAWILLKRALVLLAIAVALLLAVRYGLLRKLFFVTLIAGLPLLTSCARYCPVYDGSLRYQGPLRKRTFLRDDGHQRNKYSRAAQEAADQTDGELYPGIQNILFESKETFFNTFFVNPEFFPTFEVQTNSVGQTPL